MEFRLLTPEEVERVRPLWEADALFDEQQRWLREACVAKHGNHDWLLKLEEPDEDDVPGGDVQLHCGRCPAGIDDIYLDGQDMIYLWVSGDMVVEAGRHKLPYATTYEVDVAVQNLSHWNMEYGYEYDFELNVTLRGEPNG